MDGLRGPIGYSKGKGVIEGVGGHYAGLGAAGGADGQLQRVGLAAGHPAPHEPEDDVVVVADVALLDVVEELELRDGLFPEAQFVVLGLAGGRGQQVGDGLQQRADGLTKRTSRTPPQKWRLMLCILSNLRFGGDAFFA